MNIFELFGTIAINNADANKAITDTGSKANHLASTMKTAFDKAGKFAVTCGKVVASGLAVGVAGVGVLMKKSISEFADYEQLVGGLETLFKDSSDKVKRYAEEAYKNQGMSANEYMSTVTSFSASLISGLNGDTAAAAEMANIAITDMADNANKFGTDIGLIQNAYQGFAKQNYTMLDNLSLGYSGTKEEMARLINDSGVLGSAMKVSAETVNDVSFDVIIAAINTIQKRMGIAGTTAKEASETIAGSFASFKASWSNLLVGLANEEDIEPLVDMFFDAGQTVLKNVWKVVPKIKDNLVDAFKRAGERVRTVWMNNIWPSVQKFAKTKLGIDLPSWSEVELKVSGWWASIKSGVQAVCTWTLKLFESPNEAASEAGAAIKTWWTDTALPGILSVSKWTLGLFGTPVEDEATVKEHFAAWWTTAKGWIESASTWALRLFGTPIEDEATVQEHIKAWWDTAMGWVESACSWTLQLFDVPKESADTIASNIALWWDKTVTSVVDACAWALGLPSTPAVDGTANKINEWWGKVKESINLTLDLNDSESFTKLQMVLGLIASIAGHPGVGAILLGSGLTSAVQNYDPNTEQNKKALEISEAVERFFLGEPEPTQGSTTFDDGTHGGAGDGRSFGDPVSEPSTNSTQFQWGTDGVQEVDGIPGFGTPDLRNFFGSPSSSNELQTTIQNWTNAFDMDAFASKMADAVVAGMGKVTITTGNVTLNDGTLVGRIIPKINLEMGQLMMRNARG